MRQHVETYHLIPEEQKGCSTQKQGTIDQLLIDKMILQNTKLKQKNLSTAWIDYKKAFDSIPHDWLIKSLEIHKFNDTIVNFFKHSVTQWKTNITLSTNDKVISTNDINIKTGIFQGDSPSGLHFVICMLPLSWLLRKTNIGYNINSKRMPTKKINHLLFMDDLKLYANNETQLKSLLNTVQQFSDDIKMSFGLDKCKKISIKKGKLVQTENIILPNDDAIQSLDNSTTYKYLGIFESNEIKTKAMKKHLQKEYFTRVKKILKTSLNSKNTIDAINTFAVPALSYGFPILDWSITDLSNIDQETRNILKKYHMQHKNSDITRLYIPRKEGGRGLINITDHYKNQIILYSHYLTNSNENLLIHASLWETKRKTKSIHFKANKYAQEINTTMTSLTTKTKAAVKLEIKRSRIQEKKREISLKNYTVSTLPFCKNPILIKNHQHSG